MNYKYFDVLNRKYKESKGRFSESTDDDYTEEEYEETFGWDNKQKEMEQELHEYWYSYSTAECLCNILDIELSEDSKEQIDSDYRSIIRSKSAKQRKTANQDICYIISSETNKTISENFEKILYRLLTKDNNSRAYGFEAELDDTKDLIKEFSMSEKLKYKESSKDRSKKSWDSSLITDSNVKRVLKNCGLPEDYLFPENEYVEFQRWAEFGGGYIDWIIVFEVNVADMIHSNKYLKDEVVTESLKKLIDSYYEEYCDERNRDISLLDDQEEFKKAKKYVRKVFNTDERILIRMRVKDNKIQAVLEDNEGYRFDSFPGKQLKISYKPYDINSGYVQYFKAVKKYIDENF